MKKLIPPSLISGYHFILAFLGAAIYRFPSRRIKVIGVTGTKGKSTVIYFLNRILEGSGRKTASISSIKFKIGDKEWRNNLKMTMPGRFQIQKFLRRAVDAGCEFALLEVTSQGIVQHRHRFIDFDAAVFTNLHPEHIEAHGSFENYKKAKISFFEYVRKQQTTHNKRLTAENLQQKKFIINKDDKYGEEFIKVVKDENIILYPTEELKNLNLKLKLFGDFNLSNAHAALAVAGAYGLNLNAAARTLESIESVPGRMEFIDEGQPFKVVVDYAHTPDSLEKVYKTLSKTYKLLELIKNKERSTSYHPTGDHPQGGKLICVLGAAGGGRDKWKRPEFGRIASKYCNEIILTNEDPYDENPRRILSEIKSGISQPKADSPRANNFQETISNVYEILDRREAIEKAISLAKEGDVVVITGKGSEPLIMSKGGEKIPWDDREEVRACLKSDKKRVRFD